MEFFYFRVEEFFVYGGDEMAENLVGKGWYPNTRLKSFSYADKLIQDNPELHANIKNLLSVSRANLSGM